MLGKLYTLCSVMYLLQFFIHFNAQDDLPEVSGVWMWPK